MHIFKDIKIGKWSGALNTCGKNCNESVPELVSLKPYWGGCQQRSFCNFVFMSFFTGSKDWQWISWLANPAEGDARKGQASAKVRETGGRAGGTFAAARSGTIPASRASHRHLTLPHSNCCAAPRTGIKVGNQDWGMNLSEFGKARLHIA